MRLHVGLVHHEVDRAGRLQARHRGAFLDSPCRRNVREVTTGEFGMRPRPSDHDPRRLADQRRQQLGGAGRVRVDVEPDRLVATRAVDQGERLGRAAEVRSPHAFVMRDDQRDTHPSGGLEALGQQLFDPVGFVAHMRGVDGARAGEGLQEGDDLGHRSGAAGGVEQAGAEPCGAGIESFAKQAAHRRDLVGRRRAGDVRHRADAQRGMADQEHRVDRGRAGLQRRHIGAECSRTCTRPGRAGGVALAARRRRPVAPGSRRSSPPRRW